MLAAAIISPAFLGKRIAQQRFFSLESRVFATRQGPPIKRDPITNHNNQDKYAKALTFILITSYSEYGPGPVGQFRSPWQCTSVGEFKKLRGPSRSEGRNWFSSLSWVEQSNGRRGTRSGSIGSR